MRSKRLLTAFAFGVLTQMAMHAQSTGTVGWYNGYCMSGIPGYSNWYASSQIFSRTYDNFVVPTGGWMVVGVFSINAMATPGVTQVAWEIRSGVSSGNGGKVVASGQSAATQNLMETWTDGTKIYRMEVDGLRLKLAAGTYWLNVAPVVPYSSSIIISDYVCASIGQDAVGNPNGMDGHAFYYSTAAGVYFGLLQTTGKMGTSGDFSQGVLISTSSTTPAAPAITSVVNGADWQGGPIAPGEIVTVLGSGLTGTTAATQMLAENSRVSTTLDGVQVLFNGVAAPETYVGAGQINAVVPYEMYGQSAINVQVSSGGQMSNQVALTSAAAVPALFTYNGSGTGPGAILNLDYSINGPNQPASKGGYVSLFMTGEGFTTLAVTGAITTVAKTGPLTPQPVQAVTVTIDGQPASVVFYGEAPSIIAGMMQVNVQIPATARSGDLPVVVSVGGVASQAGVTVSVK